MWLPLHTKQQVVTHSAQHARQGRGFLMTSRLVQLHAAAAACLRTWAAASNQLLITFTALASAYTACGVSSECLHRGLPQSVKQRPYACQGVSVWDSTFMQGCGSGCSLVVAGVGWESPRDVGPALLQGTVSVQTLQCGIGAQPLHGLPWYHCWLVVSWQFWFMWRLHCTGVQASAVASMHHSLRRPCVGLWQP